MKKIIILILSASVSTIGFSQDKWAKEISKHVVKRDAEAHLTFLASDEMRGRGTGSPEIAIAANYIAAQFRLAGLAPAPGSTSYFQDVGLKSIQMPSHLDLTLGNDQFHYPEDLVMLRGNTLSLQGQFVFVGFGQPSDFEKLDVAGKVVVSLAGSSEKSGMAQALFQDATPKYTLARSKGATALIEISNFTDIPWQRVAAFFSTPQVTIASDDELRQAIPHVWLRYSDKESIATLRSTSVVAGSLSVSASSPQPIAGKNVVGYIPGSDAKLKQEYIVLTAHYDHLGVKKNASPDSIYNGARDNAIGTTAILEAASFIAKFPLRRSVIVVAFCAEEKGLLGSAWYAAHPVVPLRQTVYNFDCDGAGYNDKSMATLVDLNRTNMDQLLQRACASFQLVLKGDPDPKLNLYERSDNFNFAVKGVPAVDFSPGVTGLDEEITKYYHQPADEVTSLDFDYLEKFFRAYVYAAVLVGNSDVRPFWKAGDKFEPVGKSLYGLK